MILAAGLGTRLKPLTDKIPKALVEIGGKPMLERLLVRLRQQGFKEVVVNVHHFSGVVKDFIATRDFGLDIRISDESDELLDTGGGITKAYPLLFGKNDDPVLIHNVDIISNMDAAEIMGSRHGESILLVNDRESTRKLIFDQCMELQGWHDLKNELYRPATVADKVRNGEGKELAFSGIYTLTKAAVEEMGRLLGTGKYSIMEYFLHRGRKEKIKGLQKEGLEILDIGKPESLSLARKFFN